MEAKIKDVPKKEEAVPTHRRGITVKLEDGNDYHFPLLSFDDGLELMASIEKSTGGVEQMKLARTCAVQALSMEHGAEEAERIVANYLPADFNPAGVLMQIMFGILNLPLPEAKTN